MPIQIGHNGIGPIPVGHNVCGFMLIRNRCLVLSATILRPGWRSRQVWRPPLGLQAVPEAPGCLLPPRSAAGFRRKLNVATSYAASGALCEGRTVSLCVPYFSSPFKSQELLFDLAPKLR